MAEISGKALPPKRRLQFLLRCFGFSEKVGSEKDPVDMKLGNGRRNRLISWLRFRLKKSSATVPVDAATDMIDCSGEGFWSPKLKKSKPIISKAPASADDNIRIGIIPATGSESTRPSRRCKTEASQKWFFSGKKTEPNSTRRELSQPNSTTEKLQSSTRTAKFLHSVSLPAPTPNSNHQKRLQKTVSQLHAASATAMRVPSDHENPNRRQQAPKPSRFSNPEQAKSRKKFDPVIIMVAVAIMLLYGRLCAILCTSALFYVDRHLRSKVERQAPNRAATIRTQITVGRR